MELCPLLEGAAIFEMITYAFLRGDRAKIALIRTGILMAHKLSTLSRAVWIHEFEEALILTNEMRRVIGRYGTSAVILAHGREQCQRQGQEGAWDYAYCLTQSRY